MAKRSTAILYKMPDAVICKSGEVKYHAVGMAREEVERLNTVAVHRELVKAKLNFE
jgi:hypothetical protein